MKKGRSPDANLAAVISTWATLVGLFFAARLIFGFSYFASDLGRRSDQMELLRVLFLAERLDVSIATFLCLPLIVLALVTLLLPRELAPRVPRLRGYPAVAITVSAFACVVAHFFFYYYKDRFNTFFWEFWEDAENARLVIWSIPEEIPMGKVALYLGGALLGSFGLKRALGAWAMSVARWVGERRPRWASFIALLALAFIGTRGTFDTLPLPKQYHRGLVSPVHAFNLLHANPLSDIYLSREEVPDFSGVSRANLKNYHVSPDAAAAAFAGLQPALPLHDKFVSPAGYLEVRYKVPGLAHTMLKRRPKHIVLVFMESFAAWTMNVEDAQFGARIAPVFRNLREHGLYFDNYYQAGSGTIDNLTKGTYQIPTPVGFPEATSFSASNKSFPTSLPHLVRDFGYQPRFYYGGSLSWHNTGYVFKNLGFDQVTGENALTDVEKTRFGLFDEDLYKMVAADLEKAQEPTFNLIMTLSNHPPFRLPEGFKVPFTIEVPPSLKPMLNDPENFIARYSSYYYSDYALGQFLKNVASTPAFKDTLFLFTADHAHDGTFSFQVEDYLNTKKIPLLIYGPDLLAVPPQTFHWHGTHMDLGATIVSLLNEQDSTMASFGRSLLVPPTQPDDPLFSADENCLGDVCVVQFQPYLIEPGERLQSCHNEHCTQQAEQIGKLRQAYDRLGLHYMFGFRADKKPQG